APLARELSSTPDLGNVELLGGLKHTVRVIADAKRLNQFGVTLQDVYQSLKTNHALLPAGKNWSDQRVLDVEVGGKLRNKKDIEGLAIGSRGGRIVKVGDVAAVVEGPEERVR